MTYISLDEVKERLSELNSLGVLPRSSYIELSGCAQKTELFSKLRMGLFPAKSAPWIWYIFCFTFFNYEEEIFEKREILFLYILIRHCGVLDSDLMQAKAENFLTFWSYKKSQEYLIEQNFIYRETFCGKTFYILNVGKFPGRLDEG